MKILLVMPGRGQIVHQWPKRFRSLLPPSPLLEVAGLSPPDVEVSIFDELAQGQINAETLGSADIVGVSGLSTSHFGAYRVAKLARELGKPVVAGGMHVTGRYNEGNGDDLLEHYDAIVVGRLTRALWRVVIQDLSSGDSQRVYQVDPNEPWEFVVPPYNLIDPKHYYFPSLRSSAGCPYGCDFCTVNQVCQKLEVKPRDILKREIELLPEIEVLRGIKMPIVDCADSFGADYAHTVDVVLPLLHASGRRWFTEITIRNLLGIGNNRESLIPPMADAGCMGVYVGIESIHKRVVPKALGRDMVEQAIREAHEAGLIVMGSMILDITGEETEESIREMIEWVIEQGLDLLQYSLVAALPGSRTREQAIAQGKLISWNPEHYDGAWPTVKHPNLSPEQLIDLLRYAYYRTYSVAGVGKRILGHTNRPLNLFANGIVRQLSHRWWGKVGYDHWLATGGTAS